MPTLTSSPASPFLFRLCPSLLIGPAPSCLPLFVSPDTLTEVLDLFSNTLNPSVGCEPPTQDQALRRYYPRSRYHVGHSHSILYHVYASNQKQKLQREYSHNSPTQLLARLQRSQLRLPLQHCAHCDMVHNRVGARTYRWIDGDTATAAQAYSFSVAVLQPEEHQGHETPGAKRRVAPTANIPLFEERHASVRHHHRGRRPRVGPLVRRGEPETHCAERRGKGQHQRNYRHDSNDTDELELSATQRFG